MTLSLQLPSACKSLRNPLPCGLRQVPSSCPRTQGTNLCQPITAQVLSHRQDQELATAWPRIAGHGVAEPTSESQACRAERVSLRKRAVEAGPGRTCPPLSLPQAGSFLGGSCPWSESDPGSGPLCLWLRGVGAAPTRSSGKPLVQRSGASHSASTDLFGEGLTAEVTGWGHTPSPQQGKGSF